MKINKDKILYQEITEKYEVDIDDCAIFYLFDRDPKSNTENDKYLEYHNFLKNPWENADNQNGGQLLLSYPSLEGYEISCFFDDSYKLMYGIGKELKDFIAQKENQKSVQINKIDEDAIKHATVEFFNYININSLQVDMDKLDEIPKKVYQIQEDVYIQNSSTYRVMSLLTIAFLQLGLLEIEDEFEGIYLPPKF